MDNTIHKLELLDELQANENMCPTPYWELSFEKSMFWSVMVSHHNPYSKKIAQRIVETWNNYDAIKADSIKWYGAYMELLSELKDCVERMNRCRKILQTTESNNKGFWGILDTGRADEAIQKYTSSTEQTKTE